MKCSFRPVDGRIFCDTHGVYMDGMMAHLDGTMCPLGYVAEVERRFKFEADEVRASLQTFGRTLEAMRERLEAVEDKLGE